MALKEFDFEKEPIVSVVKKILTDAIKMKATDIHFDPKQNELLIRFRINGNLTEYTIAPESVKVNIITRIKILGNMNITESLVPQIGAITFDVEGTSTNMRVSSLPVSDGEKIVIHISNYAKNIKSISKIGISKEDVVKIKSLLKEPQGIILITGTTSSGKTTTMYSILKELNNKSINIISIEDPIKMKIEGINQVQIAPEKGLTYKSLLKNILLQDPNVICINELIDDETTRSALRASTTGRLVISTMHTKSAFKTIETLLNMDVENYLLGTNLNGIISQRLVKKLCPNCRIKKKATNYEKKVIKHILNKDIEELYYPKGCTECQNGYTDQLPIIEVVPINEELSMAISNNKNRELIRNIIYEENNSLLIDGFNKLIDGETSFDEIIRIIDIKTDFTADDEEIVNIILGNSETSELKETTKITDTEDENKEVTTDDSDEGINTNEEETTQEETSKEEDNDEKEEITKVTTDEETENNVKEEPKEKNYYDEVPNKIEIKNNNEIIKALTALEKESAEKVEENTKNDEKETEPTEETKEVDNNKDEKNEKDIKEDSDKDSKKDKEETSKEDKIEEQEESSKEEEKQPDNESDKEQSKEDESEEDSNPFSDDDDEDDFNYGNSYSIF